MVDDPAGMVVDVDIPINGRLFTGPLTRSEEEDEEEEGEESSVMNHKR